MITIEIDKKPAIFDDPDKCSDSSGVCRLMKCGITISYCMLFLDKFGIHEELKKDAGGRSFKCLECKAAWKLAKDKQPKLCPVCHKPRGMVSDIGGGMITPCPHCNDEVPF